MTDIRQIPLLRQACACKAYCGDVPQADDHPLAVCKGLPAARARSYDVTELVQFVEQPDGSMRVDPL